jgi:hypothetical protein
MFEPQDRRQVAAHLGFILDNQHLLHHAPLVPFTVGYACSTHAVMRHALVAPRTVMGCHLCSNLARRQAPAGPAVEARTFYLPGNVLKNALAWVPGERERQTPSENRRTYPSGFGGGLFRGRARLTHMS